MAEVFGYKVTKLARMRIMNVELKGIEPGRWRYLNAKEIEKIETMVADSSKTQEPSASPRKQKQRRK